jgi:very-short-patch-repair endonuclease
MRGIKESILKDLSNFKKVAQEAKCFRDIRNHYGLPDNGKLTPWFRDLMKSVGLSDSMYEVSRYQKHNIYHDIIQKCPRCEKDFKTKSGGKRSKTYCSQICANQGRKTSEQTKQKMRQIQLGRRKLGLTKVPATRICEYCKKIFVPRTHKTRFCSNFCRRMGVWRVDGYKDKIVSSMRKKWLNGELKGWRVRNKQTRSYAERFFEKVLQSRHIQYEPELPVGGYSIDFAMELPNGFKIALEIDGKQHKQRERHDRCRDIVLEKNGWNVYRIPWRSINTDVGKEYIRLEIKKFIDYYRSMLL